MHSHLSFRIKAAPPLLACALGLFSGSVSAADNWQTLPPTKIGAAITDQIESHPDLTYARYGDRELQLDLFRPKYVTKPLPAIVCIHGGGWQSGNRLNHGHLAKALAARGFVAVSISYRLSGEATFPAQIHDAKAAVRWLRANAKQWGIDPDAIGATGLSAGGNLTALLATSGGVDSLEGEGGNANFSSAIQAAAPMGAQSDFTSERNREISKTADIWQKFLGGSQEDVPETYQLASPRSHLDAKDPPTIFITGEFDDASTHADEFRRDCMALGISSELFVIPGAPHPFLTKQSFFDIAIDRLDAFFSLHLNRKGIPVSQEELGR